MRTTLIAAALAALSLGAMAQPCGYGHGPGAGDGPHGMMQGYGMGAPMMRGGDYAQVEELGLSDEQRAKVLAIRKDARQKMFDLMDQMRDLRYDARKRIDAALTPEQREKLRERRGPGS